MAKKDEAVVTVKADTSQLDQAFDKANNAVKDLGTAGEESIGLLDNVTGGWASSLVKARAGIGSLIAGLNLTKVALIATGIGAFVVAIGSLVAYFTQTKEGAKALEVAVQGLGAVFNVLIERAGKFGSAIVKLFKGDFKGAVDDATAAVSGFGAEVQKEFNAVTELTKATQALRASQRGIVVETAKQRAEIERLKMVSDDVNKSIKERIKAAKDAAALEEKLVAERVRIAQEEFRIEKEKQAMSYASEEDLMRLAELEAEVFNIQQESRTLQTELQNKVNGLRAEGVRIQQEAIDKANEEKAAQQALTQAAIEAEAERRAKVLEGEAQLIEQLNQLDETATERSVRLAEEEYEKRLLLAGENAELQKQVETQFQADIAAIQEQARRDKANAEQAERDARIQAEKAAADERVRIEQEGEEAKRQLIADTFTILTNLATLFNNGEEKKAKRSFTIQKTLGIAQATINTYLAVADALAKDSVTPFSRYVSAAAAAAVGAAQIAGIARQQFEGGGGVTAPSAPSMSNATTPAAAPAPGFSLNQDNSGFRAYVLGSEVSNQMQADQRLRDRVALFG